MRIAGIGVLLATGCSFSADYGGTAYRCEAGVCPDGYLCGLDGYCHLPGGDAAAAGDGSGADAPPGIDGAPVDADLLADPPWWDAAWSHRRRITIHNVSGVTIAEPFQVGFAVDIESLIGGGTYAQVRVIHHNPTTGAAMQMTRVIDDTAGTDEHLWLPLWETLDPGDTVDHYWLYYGNDSPSGTVLNDPSFLFEFYAPFSATDNRLEFTGTATVNGELTLGPSSNIRTLSPYRWGTGYAVDFTMRVPAWGARFWGGFQRVDDFTDDEPWIIWISRGSTQITPEFLAYDTGVTVADVGTAVAVPTSARIYSIERFPTATTYSIEFSQIDRLTHGDFTTDLQLRLANESANNIYFDMLRVRQACDPPPEVTLGPEETYP
ncbi:MAG TPA: hypothetical protein VL172_12360 [Kofleriaceae bacterium]|nr:hypothetical protein [Kofleriaceae bacterium]